VKGAPIRFIAAVTGGWVCIRIAVLLPDVDRLTLAGGVLAPPAAAVGRSAASAPGPAVLDARGVAARPGTGPRVRRGAPAVLANILAASPLSSAAAKQDGATRAGSERVVARPLLVPATLGTQSADPPQSRWIGSAWLLARGGASGTLSGGRLGASQAGIRMLYQVDTGRRIALAARIATPLRGRGTEAAIGVDWQPTSAPVHLVAEQRIAIDGARGGPTAMVIAGLNPTPVAAGFRLEAYAQAGAILRGGRAEAFGDAAVRLSRPVAMLGAATIDAGMGAWGAGQRGATRVDLGPTIGAALPLAGRSTRISLDWRHRVAGDARPGSGPALSIGTDF
jgi:hypothetical protein